ncbi:MAG: hypothetical protein JWN14_2629 [Chthonomonadales bacterium]|nr:hypothetical protein [Chthonomonadales bacterium]
MLFQHDEGRSHTGARRPLIGPLALQDSQETCYARRRGTPSPYAIMLISTQVGALTHRSNPNR